MTLQKKMGEGWEKELIDLMITKVGNEEEATLFIMVREFVRKLLNQKEEDFIKDFKRWLKGRNINAREKDMIRRWLNEKK
jgi:hypothetical protein